MSTATLSIVPQPATSDEPPEADRPGWVTLASACKLTRLHETTILRLAIRGDVAYKRRGRRTLFNAADLLLVSE